MKEDKDNKKNSKIIIIILAIVVVLGLLALLLFGPKGDKPSNNNSGSGNTQEEPVIVEPTINTEFQSMNIDESFNNFKDYDGKNSKYEIIKDSLPKSIEINYMDKLYKIELSTEGKVYLTFEEEKKELSNISNAISIDYCDEWYGEFYIILGNGDLYIYQVNNTYANNYLATKYSKIKDVTNFVKLNYCPLKDSGCSLYFGIVDKNNEYIELSNMAY